MAMLLIHRETGRDNGREDGEASWQAVPLDEVARAVYLVDGPDGPVVAATGRQRPREAVGYLLKHGERDGRDNWVLFTGETTPLRVNGEPSTLGVHAMRHRDELRLGPGMPVVVFSAERVARIEPLPEGAAETPCARCGRPVAAGSPAVRCAHCRAWFHQADNLPCFTYTDICSRCRQPISLEDGPQWLPENP